MLRVLSGWRNASIGIFLVGMSACSPLELITIKSERSDLQLMVDTLNTSLRDAQRTVAELRAEADARRQESADAQIARAQLEGRIREAERRLTEARTVIDLQREELAGSRSEREELRRARAALHGQWKQLQKPLSKTGKQVRGNVSPAAMSSPRDGQLEVATIGPQQDAVSVALEENTRVVSGSAIQVVVKSGDTLWSLARRYHTSVGRIMVRNALPDDHIQVGQALWLTEPPAEAPERERM